MTELGKEVQAGISSKQGVKTDNGRADCGTSNAGERQDSNDEKKLESLQEFGFDTMYHCVNWEIWQSLGKLTGNHAIHLQRHLYKFAQSV